MSCITYVHNNPLISQMQISGTSCGGSLVNYIVSYGQSVCMDSSKPVINLNGLQISGSCTSVTPTPTPTNGVYCYTSGLTYYTATYQCPNNGVDYLDQYGVIKVTIFKDLIPSGDHPDYSFTVTNGTEVENFEILRGQEFNEFIYPKVDFRYTDTGCTTTTLSDWTITNTGGLSVCSFITPTPTPTTTVTPSAYPVCPEQIQLSDITNDPNFNGVYDRIYSYTGGTFNGGYWQAPTVNGPGIFNTGVMAETGFEYAVYEKVSGSTYYTIIMRDLTATTPSNSYSWGVVSTTGTSLVNGGIRTLSNRLNDENDSGLNVNGIYYPKSGNFPPLLPYISYPNVCPTPTPTPSITPTNTITPTITPTQTPTNTQTPTLTPTPTPTQTGIPSGTTEANAYLAEVLSNGGTLNSTISAATQTLFTSLVSNNLYNKMIAFYPIIGGVANSHRLNANLNTTYNLVYSGGWTHNSSGQKPNGTNAFANTNYAVPLNPYSNSFGVYVSTSATTNAYEIDMGVQNGSNYWHLAAYWTATNDSRWYNIDKANGYVNTTNGGNYHNVRTSQSAVRIYRNGSVVSSNLNTALNNQSSGAYTTYLGALNGAGTAQFLSTKNEIFAYIATGMTTGDTVTLDSIINTFQTSLGRNTY